MRGVRLRLRRHRGDGRRRAAERDADVPARRRVVRRARRRAPVARVEGRDGEPRRGRGRRGRDPARRRARRSSTASGQTSCEAQRQAVALAEAVGAVVDPARRRAARASPTRRSARARRRSARSATAPSSSSCGGRTRSSPTRACSSGCAWIAPPADADARRRRRAAHGDRRGGRRLRRARRRARLRGAVGAARARRGRAARSRPRGRPAARRARRARRAPARRATTSPSSTARSTSSARWRCSRSCATSAATATRSRSALRGDGNARGAEDVLAWQTGFPAAVSFARGYPRANPGELSAAALLERGEVDAALVVASDALEQLPGLRELPMVVVDARATATAEAARVAFATAADGIEVAGTVHRMDGVPVPLRALLDGGPPGRRGRAGRDRGAAVMLRIAGGRVYDPANGIAGEVRDVCVQDGKIVADVPAHARRIDARGMVVMPGGVDIHAHIAGPGGQRRAQAAARGAPRRRRSSAPRSRAPARGGTVPSTFATGYRYALLGYTTVVEAATPPLAARHTLAELRDTPVIDAAFLVLMGNNLPLFELIRSEPGARARGDRLVAAGHRRLRRQARQPRRRRDVEARQRQRDLARRRRPRASRRGRSSRRSPPRCTSSGCRTRCTSTATTSACPATTARRSTRCARSTAAAPTSPTCSSTPTAGEPGGRPRSRAPELAEYLGAHPELSADVGQVMFGPATTMTADAPVSAVLREITHGRWVNADTEAETGCGIVPFTYRERNYVHALQWGIGLELFLLSRDPWRLVLSTDHPNGGSFLSYPRLIRLLMDREFRNEQIRPREQAGDEAHRPARRPRSRVHAGGDRDHHARRAGAPARAARQGPPRRRRRRRHHDLRRPRRSRGDVRRAALRHQGRARGRRGRRAARGRARAACCGSAPSTTRASSPRWRRCSRTATACSSRAIPCASRGCSSPRAPSPRQGPR